MSPLKNLYKRLDELFPDICSYCIQCEYEDCIGYVWLLSEEIEELYKKGVQIVEINREISFLDSFCKKNGRIDVDVVKPPCSLRDSNGKCSIYPLRPLVCRLYPLDLKNINGDVLIVIHMKCLFVDRLAKNENVEEFVHQCINTLKEIDKELLEKIEETFRAVESISAHFEEYEPSYMRVLDLSAYLRNQNTVGESNSPEKKK